MGGKSVGVVGDLVEDSATQELTLRHTSWHTGAVHTPSRHVAAALKGKINIYSINQ